MYNALRFIYNALRYINIALHYIVFYTLKNISVGGRNNLFPHCIQIFCRVIIAIVIVIVIVIVIAIAIVIAIVIAGRKVLFEVCPPVSAPVNQVKSVETAAVCPQCGIRA